MCLGLETTHWSADSNADLYIINKDVVKILFKTATERPVVPLEQDHFYTISTNGTFLETILISLRSQSKEYGEVIELFSSFKRVHPCIRVKAWGCRLLWRLRLPLSGESLRTRRRITYYYYYCTTSGGGATNMERAAATNLW